MLIRKKVAVRGKNKRLSWEKLPNINTIKQSYKRTPEKFVEEETILYLLEVDKPRLNKSLASALKICGSAYALVLVMTNGELGREFNATYANIANHNLQKKAVEYTTQFEKIIKNLGIYVGTVGVDGVEWFDGDYHIKLSRMKVLYSLQPENFHILNNRLYYLRCIVSVVEDMFFKCVAIAGTEYALASALSSDDRTRQVHVMNFKRLGFKQAKTFSLYANLFSDYLTKHQPLFEVELDD